MLSSLITLLCLAPIQKITLKDESVAGLLHREDVQAELRFTPNQRQKWSEIDRLPTGKSGTAFDGDPIDLQDPQVVETRDAEREKKVWKFLGPDESVRMLQLFVQRAGVRVLLRSDYQKILNLSDDQMSQVRQVKAQHDGDLRSLIKKLGSVKGDLDRLDPKRVRDVRNKIESDLVEGLDAIPTQEQRNQLEELGGKKFRFLDRKFD